MPFPLAKLLDDVVQLCPLPATTQKVIELTNSDRATIGAIVGAISLDPALATAVLRVANSALYAGIKVSQLNAAVMRIGMRELRELASAMSVLAAFRSKDVVQAALHEQSVLAGGIANRLAKALKLMPPSTASTCGLLCEIGAMACLALDGKEYAKLWKESSRDYAGRITRERERYSVTSFEIGQRFLLRNSVPEEVASAVGAELSTGETEWQAPQKLCLLARHSANALSEFGNDETVCVALLDELTNKVAINGLTGASLYELLLREGLMRDIGKK